MGSINPEEMKYCVHLDILVTDNWWGWMVPATVWDRPPPLLEMHICVIIIVGQMCRVYKKRFKRLLRVDETSQHLVHAGHCE